MKSSQPSFQSIHFFSLFFFNILSDGAGKATGITLQRPDYYTIPPLNELIDFVHEDGTCIVPNFTIGHNTHGAVYYDVPIDVANLNLDELVHIRHKEVEIYRDDADKPPVGEGLNRSAQITLHQVWPTDTSLHEPIRDRNRLEEMNYEAKLRAVCDKNDSQFIEYQPGSGTWVFKVNHFTKYGCRDMNDEADWNNNSGKLKGDEDMDTEMLFENSETVPNTASRASHNRPRAVEQKETLAKRTRTGNYFSVGFFRSIFSTFPNNIQSFQINRYFKDAQFG